MKGRSRRNNGIWSRQKKKKVMSKCLCACMPVQWWCEERQWQLMASFPAAKPNRQTPVIACLIWAVERPGVMMATE